ncbi:unnamed protein product [Camellia sinensis]
MKSIAFSSRWHSLSLLILLTFVSAIPHNIPRLSVFDHKSLRDPSNTIPAFVWEDLETYFYNQTLDHFNYNPQSYATFKQRYVINSKYWGGANESAPIFVYLGAEAPIDGDIQFIGFLPENAPNFKALIVYIELSAQVSAAQAIADYAEVILYLKENLSVQNSPVIVIGGSYGGNFQVVSESCYETIKQSWSASDEVASQPNGPLSDSFELKEYLDGLYSGAAQYDRPPRYPVTVVCGGIAGAPNGTDILGRIFAGVVAARVNRSCYINEHYNYSDGPYGDWDWQVAILSVKPATILNIDQEFAFFGGVDTPPASASTSASGSRSPTMRQRSGLCFGRSSSPSTETKDIKAILQRFASNIIFSNGLRDPYSCAGVLQDISETDVAVYTVNGSHCLDILPTDQSDPQWLTDQRNTEVKIIQGWINQYYADLLSSSKH